MLGVSTWPSVHYQAFGWIVIDINKEPKQLTGVGQLWLLDPVSVSSLFENYYRSEPMHAATLPEAMSVLRVSITRFEQGGVTGSTGIDCLWSIRLASIKEEK